MRLLLNNIYLSRAGLLYIYVIMHKSSFRLETTQLRSFLALQNLISALPPEAWGGPDNLATVWVSLCALPVAGEHIIGVQRTLADKLLGYGIDVSNYTNLKCNDCYYRCFC